MKKIKYLLTITVLSFMLVVLSGCSIMFIKAKTFTNEGLSITLTNRFYEKDHIAFTSYYESDKMMVVVIKEKFYSLSMVGIYENSTVEDYLKKLFLQISILQV